MELSKIKNLYGFEDGDTLTPGMGVQIATGHALQQYYNPNTFVVTATDFTKYPAKLFPQPYSSKQGTIVVLSNVKWYYNNIADSALIFAEDGSVKSAYADLFEKSTIAQNGKTFPALTINGNLVSPTRTDAVDKRIYCVGEYRGMSSVCQQVIPIQSSVGDAYNVLVSVVGENGIGDNVLSSDNDWIQYSVYLQLAGNTINGASYKWQRNENGVWKNLTNTIGVTEINGNILKIYDAAVNGAELFRVVATYNGKEYIKTFEATDIHDPYYIDDGCNIKGDAIKTGEKATFSPKVYARQTGEHVSGFTFSYTILKRSDASVITAFDHTELTYDNVTSVGGVTVRINATKKD